MTESTENLLLEHLKRFQTTLARIEHRQEEHTQRLGRIEIALAGMRRDMAHNDEAWAEQSVRIDRINERIERIERRLELV
jgi:predicted trehalose synthase